MSRFVCNLCGVSKANLWQTNFHIRHFHTKDNKCLKCYFCYSFVRGSELESHMRWHTKELPYMCRKCRFKCKAYNFKSSLLRHYKSHHSGYKINTSTISLKCYFCGRINRNVFFLQNHLRVALTFEKPFKCDISECTRTFPKHSYKYLHVNNFCTKNPHRKKDELKKITCYFCHVKLSRKSFYLHINGHTREESYQCSHCNLRLAHPQVRKRHILCKHNIHLHQKCNFCGVSRVTVGELNSHIRERHTKDSKKFQCYFCRKQFSRVVKTSHMVMHTNEFHYKCKYCPAEYKENKALQNHYFKNPPELLNKN